MRRFVLSQVHILTHYVQLIYISVRIICIKTLFKICPQFNCVLCKIKQFIMLSLLWLVVYGNSVYPLSELPLMVVALKCMSENSLTTSTNSI